MLRGWWANIVVGVLTHIANRIGGCMIPAASLQVSCRGGSRSALHVHPWADVFICEVLTGGWYLPTCPILCPCPRPCLHDHPYYRPMCACVVAVVVMACLGGGLPCLSGEFNVIS